MKHRPARKSSYQLTNFIAVLLLLFIVFVSVGYFFVVDGPTTDPRRAELRAEFSRNLELWESRTPAAYGYNVARRCACGSDHLRPYRVSARDDLARFAYASPLAGGPADVEGSPPEPLQIADLFRIIDDHLEQAESIEVSYDPAFGFPTRLVLDRSAAIDDELRVDVYDFEVSEYRRR